MTNIIIDTIDTLTGRLLVVVDTTGARPTVRIGDAMLAPAQARQLAEALRSGADFIDSRALLRPGQPSRKGVRP